jgi:hypothetical protein
VLRGLIGSQRRLEDVSHKLYRAERRGQRQ